MNTIQNVGQRVQALAAGYIPKKLHPRFFTGVEALSTKGLASLNANGRSLTVKRSTGENRIRRLVTETRFPLLLLKLIAKEFLPVHGTIRVSLDHSTFGDFTLAVFAMSTGRGRALPIWCGVTKTGKGHALLKPLLREFQTLVDQLSYQERKRVIFVMDRWFAIPKLLTWIDDHDLKFVVRLKASCPLGVPWESPGTTIPTGEISQADVPVTYAGRDWRFVRSDYRPGMRGEEPWMLLTNLSSHKFSRQQVIRTYAKRFEIEEFFKDIKWIERYEWHQIRTARVVRTVFMFTFLGWWLLYRACQAIVEKARAEGTAHPKKKLSWFRSVWEYWERIRLRPLFVSSP
jgi:hypothetical protein